MVKEIVGRDGVKREETSDDRLQMNILTNFERGLLSDVTVHVQGREIQAHKFILAAQSDYFARAFQADSSPPEIQFNGKYKVVKALIRFMYFGGVLSDDLTPDDGLDLLVLSEDLQVTALNEDDIMPLILPRLTQENCIAALNHPALPKYEDLVEGITHFVGEHLLTMLKTIDGYRSISQDYTGGHLMDIPKSMLCKVVGVSCYYIDNAEDAALLVNFVKSHTGAETVVDLLRETKSWKWSDPQDANVLSSPDGKFRDYKWVVENVQQAMATEHPPGRIAIGGFFDWHIRLDYGDRNRLRIVYESARPHDNGLGAGGQPRCVNRFPAAMFSWRVLFRGKDVYDDKAVFICFPENVSLHWSTTLPRPDATELMPNDDLTIEVHMAENPMLSLILYYFSSDLKGIIFNEDILNRLPHIEYRCLSSYSLVKTHIPEGGI